MNKIAKAKKIYSAIAIKMFKINISARAAAAASTITDIPLSSRYYPNRIRKGTVVSLNTVRASARPASDTARVQRAALFARDRHAELPPAIRNGATSDDGVAKNGSSGAGGIRHEERSPMAHRGTSRGPLHSAHSARPLARSLLAPPYSFVCTGCADSDSTSA